MTIGTTPEAFDSLMSAEYSISIKKAVNISEGDHSYFGTEVASRPGLAEIRDHIRTVLRGSDYFSYRGSDEIESFVEGFTAAVILLDPASQAAMPSAGS